MGTPTPESEDATRPQRATRPQYVSRPSDLRVASFAALFFSIAFTATTVGVLALWVGVRSATPRLPPPMMASIQQPVQPPPAAPVAVPVVSAPVIADAVEIEEPESADVPEDVDDPGESVAASATVARPVTRRPVRPVTRVRAPVVAAIEADPPEPDPPRVEVEPTPTPPVPASTASPPKPPAVVPVAAKALQGTYVGRTWGRPVSIDFSFQPNGELRATLRVAQGDFTETVEARGDYRMDGAKATITLIVPGEERSVYSGDIADGVAQGRVIVDGRSRGKFVVRR